MVTEDLAHGHGGPAVIAAVFLVLFAIQAIWHGDPTGHVYDHWH